MSRFGAIGVGTGLVLILVAVPASIVLPNTSADAVSGVRSVSVAENEAAAKLWTSHQQSVAATTSATPPTTPPPPTTTPPTTTNPPTTTAPPAAPQDANTEPAVQTSGVPSTGVPAVGALFSVDADGLNGHYCTASVVDSPAGDIVLTAAHCIHDGAGGDYRADIAFVPGYHDGQDPYGVWVPSKLVVDPRWISDSDPDLDFGFLVVHKQGDPGTVNVQAQTGANELGTSKGFALPVRVTGYPDDTNEPVTCQTESKRADTYQLRFDCGGFPTGTSGGPWVTDVDPKTQLGTVVGVIGGYEGGGDTDDVSYSSYFDDDIQNLYATALSS